MEVANFGVISDIHQANHIEKVLEALLEEGAHGFVLLGDLGETGEQIYYNVHSTVNTGKPTIAILGSSNE
jgi:predicted phosphodiesterase